MPKISAGLLMYRLKTAKLELLLVHPGGPFWRNKDLGAWAVPKGLIEPGEDALEAAKREFEEELGFKPEGNFLMLNSIQQKGGKIVQVWAFEGDCDPTRIKSNHFEMEWPPHSGRRQQFPEVDRAEWFDFPSATAKINPAQVPLLQQLKEMLDLNVQKER